MLTQPDGPGLPRRTPAGTNDLQLGEASAAARAAPGLAELQNRMVGRLRIDLVRMATVQAGRTQRRVAVAVTFGLSALLDIGALIYALTR